MTGEQDTILKALRVAIDMENDGQNCYLQASEGSSNEVGKKLLKSLAAEEATHRQKFEQIFEAIRNKKGWPKISLRPGKAEGLRADFAKTCELVGANVTGVTAEFKAIKEALDKEKKSYDFYHRQSEIATYDAERDFYKALASEEREHQLILVDYYEYLTSPVDWFTKMEHHSLDGG